MDDVYQVLGLGAVAMRKMRGDRDRAVAPPGATDRDHEVCLALGQVLGEQVVEQRVKPVVEGLELPIAIDEFDDLRVLSGHFLLVKAALDAVEQWRYTPTMLNGEPVEVITTIEVTFTLSQ